MIMTTDNLNKSGVFKFCA